MNAPNFIEVSFSQFKAFCQARSISPQRIIVNGTQMLRAADSYFALACNLIETTALDEIADYNATFGSTENQTIEPKASGFPIYRPATTKPGWHYCPRYLSWTTAKYSSLHNYKIDMLTPHTDGVLKFFDESMTELKRSDYDSDLLFQTALTASCKFTAMDWHSTFDFDVIGTVFLNGLAPSGQTWGAVLAAPDIPANLGGNVPFLDGGFPIHLLGPQTVFDFNGVTTKSVIADAVYKSNKFRILIDHVLGEQLEIGMGFKKFNA